MSNGNCKATAAKTVSGVAYVTLQADMASREGGISALLADLFFQCACVPGIRTVEEWDRLVNDARSGECSIGDVLEIDALPEE